MSELILPASCRSPNAGDMTGVVHRPDSFVAGLAGDPGLSRIVRAIVAVVDDSMSTHPMRGGSNKYMPEWERRKAFVVAVFRELQGDLRWTTDRALSMLRPALSAHLDGRPSPINRRVEQRTLWAPDPALANAGAIRVDDPALAPAGPADGVESLTELRDKLRLDDGDDE